MMVKIATGLVPLQLEGFVNFPAWVFKKLGSFHTALDRSGKNLFGGGDTDMIRRVRSAGFEVWFAPAAVVRHQLPASRTTFRYATRHAFDSARLPACALRR